MKQLEDQLVKERQIAGLYTKHSLKRKSKSNQKDLRPRTADQPEEQSPRRLNDMIDEIRQSRDELRRLQEAPLLHRSSLGKINIKELTDKYVEESEEGLCLSKKCSVREVEERLKSRCQDDRLDKLKRMLKQQLKKKQACEYWKTERTSIHLRQLEEKVRLKLDLKYREEQWKCQLKLSDRAKRSERNFCHVQNMERIDMMRRQKKKAAAQQLKIVLEREKESWRDMKFKEFNSQRVASARKQLEEDTIELYRSRRQRSLTSRSRPMTIDASAI